MGCKGSQVRILSPRPMTYERRGRGVWSRPWSHLRTYLQPAPPTGVAGLDGSMRKAWLFGTIGAAVILASAAILIFNRTGKPSDAEWQELLLASRASGMASAASDSCAINSRVLSEVIGARRKQLRLDGSARAELDRQFLAGESDVMSIMPLNNENCGKITELAKKALATVGGSLPSNELERIARGQS